MAAKKITIRLVAYSDAAGKYEPDTPLNGNEDNFYIDDDILDDIAGPQRTDTPVALSAGGCIMAVADGMGGQNAGEVASEIAVDTVAEMFRHDRITPEIIRTPESRAEYIRRVIAEADRRVKSGTEGHPERAGMGSTIIISWILGDTLTVGWLGDSRAYRFNPATGLEPVSRDHTYVQELADKGIITYEDTFGHPQGNIVTRSLGDPEAAPVSDVASVKLCNGDIVMMCSDGLSGVVPDEPLRDITDSISGIMRENYDSLPQMRVKLMEAAERQGWYDNVTVLLCKVTGDLPAARAARKKDVGKQTTGGKGRLWAIIGVALLVIAAIVVGISFLTSEDEGSRFTASPEDDPATQTVTSSAETETIMGEAAETAVDQLAATEEAARDKNETDPQKTEVQAGESAVPVDPALAAAVGENWRKNLIQALDNIINEAPEWKDQLKSLSDKIKKAGDDKRKEYTQQVNRYNSRLTYYHQAKELLPTLTGDNVKECKSLIANMLEWNIEKIKETLNKLSTTVSLKTETVTETPAEPVVPAEPTE